MNKTNEAKGVKWIEEYKELQSILDQAEAERILSQLDKAHKDAPELYAAFRMLSLALYDQIGGLGFEGSESGNESVLNVIHPTVVEAVLNPRVSPIVDEWKRRWCRWATRVWWKKFRAGIFEEPPNC